jgi:hypothetical protein
MKPLILFVIICFLILQPIQASTPPDRLEPVDANEFPAYRRVLKEKLLLTPFDYGRVIVVPAFTPEHVISVYSRQSHDSKKLFYVTFLAPKESLWQATDGGRTPNNAKSLVVRQLDAEISESNADVIRRALIAMLSGHQRPRKWDVPSEFLYQDSTIAEFSVHREHQALSGETVIASNVGRKTKLLLDLHENLVRYCEAAVSKRPEIARNIHETATKLLMEIQAKEKTEKKGAGKAGKGQSSLLTVG